MTVRRLVSIAAALLVLLVVPAYASDGSSLMDRVEHGYADNDGVKIHYASVGEGPLVVMIHGFPDFWYSWRHQMEALADDFRVVAIDQRGYNKSGQPKEQSAYGMGNLVGDVVAVIRHLGADKATVVGHDWGGAVAWQVAINAPQVVENLVILNLPHPNGLAREMASNEEQQKNSDYARKFREGKASDPDIFFGMPMRPQTLAGWVRDADARKHYVAAFERSDFDGMLAYYKENYGGISSTGTQQIPKLEISGAPVPRPAGHGPALRWAQQHLGLDRRRLHAGDHARGVAFRAAGRGGTGQLHHEVVAARAQGGLSRAAANAAGNDAQVGHDSRALRALGFTPSRCPGSDHLAPATKARAWVPTSDIRSPRVTCMSTR